MLTTENWPSNKTSGLTLRIFCFPYAGGSANMYRTWQNKMPKTIQICPIQLPGRWDRIREKPHTRMEAVVEENYQMLQNYLDVPYLLFGHSLGALIVFYLYQKLRREKSPLPIHLFFSATGAPHLKRSSQLMHKLNDKDFINAMKARGMPFAPEILSDPDMLSLTLTILKADFEVLETAQYQEEEKIMTPMSVYGGLQDVDVTMDKLEAWKELSGHKFNLKMFSGDHFYLKPLENELLQSLKDDCFIS